MDGPLIENNTHFIYINPNIHRKFHTIQLEIIGDLDLEPSKDKLPKLLFYEFSVIYNYFKKINSI